MEMVNGTSNIGKHLGQIFGSKQKPWVKSFRIHHLNAEVRGVHLHRGGLQRERGGPFGDLEMFYGRVVHCVAMAQLFGISSIASCVMLSLSLNFNPKLSPDFGFTVEPNGPGQRRAADTGRTFAPEFQRG